MAFQRLTRILIFLSVFSGLCPADEQVIRILQTTDLHADIVPQPGGSSILNLGAALRAHRAEDPALIYVDCGDTLQGSFAGAFSQGQAVVDAMALLKPDVFVPGNHEFDFGTAVFRKLMTDPRLGGLAANVELNRKGAFPGVRFFERKGLKIAVMGLTTQRIHLATWGAKYGGFKVTSPVACLEQMLPDVQRCKPDILVLAIHEGVSGNYYGKGNVVADIARRFPQLDLILGGHTHSKIPGRRLGHTYYVQAGSHASHMAEIEISYDTSQKKVTGITSSLIDLAEQREDTDLRKRMEPWYDRISAASKELVGMSPETITAKGRPGVDNGVSEFLCRAIRWKTGVAVVMHGSQSTWEMRKGVVTSYDLYRLLPYENTIGIADLSEKEVAEILKEQLGLLSKPDFSGIFGIMVDIDWKSRKVRKVYWPRGAKRIPVAFNSYLIAGSGGRCPILKKILRNKASNLREVQINVRQVVTDYLRSGKADFGKPRRWLR